MGNPITGFFKGLLGIVTAPVAIVGGGIKAIVSNEIGKVAMKGIKLTAAMVGGLAAAPEVAPYLAQAGVTIDSNQLAIGLGAGFEMLRTFLKHKVKFLSWL